MRRAGRQRATLTLAAAVALVVGLGGAALMAVRALAADHARLLAVAARGTDLARLRAAFERKVAENRAGLVTGRADFAAVAAQAHAEVVGLARRLAGQALDPPLRELLTRFAQEEAEHETARVRLLAAGRGAAAVAQDFAAEVATRRARVDERLAALEAHQDQSLLHLRRETAVAVARTSGGLAGMLALALGAVAAAAVIEVRSRRRERRGLWRWQEFLAVASHDLKGPLAVMRLSLQGLQRRRCANPACQATLVDRLAGLDRQVGRMVELIRRNLDVSRLELGDVRLDREEVDLAALVREVGERARAARPAAGDLVIAAPAELRGRWDRVRLDEIVENLVSNALKHGGDRPVELTLEGDERTARLVVQDHGPGIAPRDQARIFECFVQLAGESRAGHGLGLWITRLLVEAHGGRIRVASAPGHGAAFIVELPRGLTARPDAGRLSPSPGAA